MFTFDAMLEDFADEILLNELYVQNAHREVKRELHDQLWDAGFRLSRDYDAVLDQ